MQKAYAKVNIFLKVVGLRGNYHEIISRFVKVKNLFDEIKFISKQNTAEFELYGDFGCALEKNTMFKAYKSLCDVGHEKKVKELFQNYAISVDKHIPSFAGLGGGSSDAATLLHMINNKANLNLNNEELANIGLNVGADVPFFIYDFNSANVSGIGEIIEKYDEEPLHVEVFTPDIKCDTCLVYTTYRDNFQPKQNLALKMQDMDSIELLKVFDDVSLNDLFKASLLAYNELEKYRKKEWFFSGSGSSFFRIKKNLFKT